MSAIAAFGLRMADIRVSGIIGRVAVDSSSSTISGAVSANGSLVVKTDYNPWSSSFCTTASGSPCSVLLCFLPRKASGEIAQIIC